MKPREIPEEFVKLSTQKRIEIKRQLAVSAKTLLLDYKENDELTSFTVLDGENFNT